MPNVHDSAPCEGSQLAPDAESKEGGSKSSVIISACAIAIALACGIGSIVIASTGVTDEAEEQATAIAIDAAYEHDWAIQYETVAHDEVSHEEVVQPVYETIVTHHSVCNECNEIVDGRAQEHIDETGHSGYSTNVPVTESRLVSEGRIDTIVDEPAHEELVATGRICTICGERS